MHNYVLTEFELSIYEALQLRFFRKLCQVSYRCV